jgi:hypothetical protein
MIEIRGMAQRGWLVHVTTRALDETGGLKQSRLKNYINVEMPLYQDNPPHLSTFPSDKTLAIEL